MITQTIRLIAFTSLVVFCGNTQNIKNDIAVVDNDAICEYKAGKKVAALLNNTIGNCNDCYIYETVDIFHKKIVFRTPVESNGKRFEKSISFNHKEAAKGVILEFKKRATHFNGIKLFLKKEKKSIINYKYVWYASEQYRKKLAEDDYEYVDAIKICTPSSFSYVIQDTLNIEEHPVFKTSLSVEDCFYCELETSDFEACKKITNK